MYGEDGRNLRYIVGLGLVIILLFVVIALIMRSGGDDKAAEAPRGLTSYVDDSNVTITETIIGPINATEDHYEYQINITNSMASMEVSKGYDGNIVNSKSYPLSTNGFSEFLSSLDRAGFTKGNTDEALKDDQGYCPTGQRYIFEIRDGSTVVQRYWQTSCGGTKTYRGNFGLTTNLFQAQIPDYATLVESATGTSSL